MAALPAGRKSHYSYTYDEVGNMLSDGTWTYTWEHGRQLAFMTDGTTTWTFTYDANGMRTGRTNGTTTYSYVYNGDQMSQLTVLFDGETYVFVFNYDASGIPISFTLNGSQYYYVTNQQGDVVSVVNSSGEQVCGYYYTAWSLSSLAMGTDPNVGPILVCNPLTYRGYVMDFETGLFYLQSRYYNAAMGRFINADVYAATGQGLLGNNMFAYCANNPFVHIDPAGESFAVIIGFNFNLFGRGMMGTINLVSTQENLGVQCSYYLPDDTKISKKQNQTVGVDIGPYIGIQYTDKKNMDELEGLAKATGGDLLLGGDILTEENGKYLGWQFGTSGFSANMHSLYTDTVTLFSISTINLPKILVDWIFEET